ncbi:hypothetical protein FHS27_002106 [Rhodopirellula rubra]|uniref:O-antigen ligase domain-containing protein n=1 Tax=Aporhodopirellula rubra TaxID=980271 RepID=A0A7W5DZ35_9BACT|nr:hypothetical protein [Aporhodopirellula rubra]MBB3206297.1 hypothetical protein [Aporhodopirellula rubra]
MNLDTGLALWLLAVVFSCAYALADWRRAIYLGILVDALRDPVRKLLPDEPVIVTLSGALVWLAIVSTVAFQQKQYIATLYRMYPALRRAFQFLMLAIIPAFAISTISYPRGYLMATIGAASYIIPCLGVLTGFALMKRERDVVRMMQWYILINVVMLFSVPMEYLNWEVPALGGIRFEWIRYRDGYIVDLMSGWYRSPDVMGLHAAQVIMFSLLLAVRPMSKGGMAWIAPVLVAGFCVLLSGRRKMVGIPMVFVAVLLGLGMYFKVAKVNRLLGFAILGLLIGGVGGVFLWSPDQSQEYTDFASSLFTEGADRSNDVILGGVITTLQQAGLLGGGLGIATQGRYYVGVQTPKHLRGWQEDGISRLFVEFGVPGVIFLISALVLFFRTGLQSIRRMPTKGNEILMQLGLTAIVAGNAASFAISHQQFSGDPVNALMVTMLMGMILRFPLMIRPLPPLRRILPSLQRIPRWQANR